MSQFDIYLVDDKVQENFAFQPEDDSFSYGNKNQGSQMISSNNASMIHGANS